MPLAGGGKTPDMVLHCSKGYSAPLTTPCPKDMTRMAPIQWQPNRAVEPLAWPHPPLMTAIGRGLLGRCPACGKTHLFNGYLRVTATCSHCNAPLGLARAEDAPPYFTILVTGHIVVPIMFAVDRMLAPSTLVMSAVFVPLTLVLALGLLRPIKGGTVGLMLTINMLKSDDDAL
jgi:uncharacterized protein (DUF983 family)